MRVSLALVPFLAACVHSQYYRRSAACPDLGCLYPPDATFIAGQAFDIRVEVQAPVNGSQAYQNGRVNTDYTLQIGINGVQDAKDASAFFNIAKPAAKNYTFSFFEDLFARDAKTPTIVNVSSTSWRHVALYQPGRYTATLYYNGGAKTVAEWTVLPTQARKAKNLILFIGDGMTTNMITAARLIGHKVKSGRYTSRLTLDRAEGYGSQSTHSLDSFITDSANSASALYTGKKMTVNGLNQYTDSTGTPFEGPKVETIFEMARRVHGQHVGIVSKAYLADATPAAVCTHTSQRSQYYAIVEQFLNGVQSNFSWTKWDGPDVLFGGGAENFIASAGNKNQSSIAKFIARNYTFATNATALKNLPNDQRALGLFTQGNISTFMDQKVYPNTLKLAADPLTGARGSSNVLDQPTLTNMTIKAIDILKQRSSQTGAGWVMMSEAALIDKEMHVLDYNRALGEILELDATVNATLQHLADIGELDSTLVVVTADHGHGFDVFGSADTRYLAQASGDRKKRDAVGTYQNSGLSNFQVTNQSLPDNTTIVYGQQGYGFPVQWNPRYNLAAGFAANPDHREDYGTFTEKQREPATGSTTNYYANPDETPNGFVVNGTLPVSNDQGVHSLTDVPVYAWGPGAELFRGPQDSTDIAFNIAAALDLGQTSNVTKYY